jgi:small-conductance mechanosensitive channel
LAIINYLPCSKWYIDNKKNFKYQFRNFIIIYILLLSILLPTIIITGTVQSQTGHDTAAINGYVYDNAFNKNPAVGYNVEVAGVTFRGNTTITGSDGYYWLNIPEGELTLTVYKNNLIYYSYDFSIESGDIFYKDFIIDSRLGLSKLSGYVWDAELDAPANGYRVNISAVGYDEKESVVTDFFGYYEFILTQTDYEICVIKDDDVYWEDTITITDQDKVLNITINEEEEKEEDLFAWLDVNEIVKNVIQNWYAFIILILLLIILPIILTIMGKFFERLSTKKFKLLDERALSFIEITIRYNVYLIIAILILWLLALIFPVFNENVWQYFIMHLPALYMILILFILMKLFLLILRRGMDYLQGSLATKPKWSVSPRYISILRIILRYAIILIFAINIIIIAMAIFGMGDLISQGVVDFFSANSGYLVFIVIIIAAMYFISGFLKSFIDDIKKREASKVSPQILDMAGKVGKILVYLMGGILIIFAFLQMANMGELGQTLILMISMIIGFVVAMAATGSIGNILSGMMINAFRPFQIGDRVKVGDTIGDVEAQNLAFVRLRTLNNEIVEIPNNNVIGDQLTNYSRSGAFAITVDVGIGYNTPSELVKKLLVEGARETKDIIDDPRPYVIITNLGDYAITYRLRAFTENAKIMFRVRSNLMANVHKTFYTHGVEILSPWYLVRRSESVPTDKQIADGWDEMDQKGKEALEKKVEEKISGGFELMDKVMEEEK